MPLEGRGRTADLIFATRRSGPSSHRTCFARTNPEGLTSLSSEMNAAHNGYYVPTVKLLRQTRRAVLGKTKPGGFFIEMVAYQAFASGLVSGNDQAEYYVSALGEASKIINNFVTLGIQVQDPTLPGHTISIRAADDELDAARTRFSDAAAAANAAIEEEDEGKAALTFRQLLGENGDGETVFPMPPGFDEDGTKRASVISPGARVVPAGTRTFG